MIYSINESKSGLYIAVADNMIEFLNNPDTVLWLLNTEEPPKGNSYNSKKHALRIKAIAYKQLLKDNPGLTSYCCNMNIADYFYNYGKRYGLLNEFKKAVII